METIKMKDLEMLTKEEVLKLVKWNNDVKIEDCLVVAEIVASNIVNQDDNGLYYANKNNQLILTDVAFISLYLNIDLDDNDYYNFNIINKHCLIDKNNDAYNLFNTIVSNEVQRYLDKNTLENIVASATHEFIEKLNITMNSVNAMIDKGDPNKVAKYLSKGVEMIANKLPDFSKMNTEEVVAELNKVKLWKN